MKARHFWAQILTILADCIQRALLLHPAGHDNRYQGEIYLKRPLSPKTGVTILLLYVCRLYATEPSPALDEAKTDDSMSYFTIKTHNSVGQVRRGVVRVIFWVHERKVFF